MISCFLEGPQGRLHYLDYNKDETNPERIIDYGREEPEAERPAIIFLPGLTNHAHYWDEIAPYFLDKYAVYALDWRGHGDSAPGTGYDYADYASDLSRLVNFLVPGRFFLVGHSLGGYVALYFATNLSDTSGLVGVVACDIKTASTEEEHLIGRKAGAKPQPFIHSLPEVAARLRAAMPDSTVSDDRLLQLAATGVFEETNAFRLKYDRAVLDFVPVNPYDFAGQVTVPTLVINGANSAVMSAKEARQLVKALPQAKRLEIAAAGHFVYLDQPAEFSEAVNNFLEKYLTSKES
jgi:pimeloyl-ACP methyl ester carboxylesterase